MEVAQNSLKAVENRGKEKWRKESNRVNLINTLYIYIYIFIYIHLNYQGVLLCTINIH
jgi:hypothetical protein